MMFDALRVLAIDDQEDLHALLKLMLEAKGFVYEGALDGVQGIAKARHTPPDLILLDLELPGLHGFEVLQALKAMTALKHVPVIILTASYLEPQSIEKGLLLGAEEYLTKPFNPEELLVRIRSVIRARKAERELQQMRKDFTSMMVHDLRAPLEGVGIALNILLTQDLPKQESQQLVGIARDQVVGLSRMLEDLLELYRAEAGMSLRLETIKPHSLVTEVMGEAELRAQECGLWLRCDVAAELPYFQGDRRILKRVLTNLLSNALKFTSQGGVTLRGGLEGEHIRFEVKDTGPGIPASELDRIFDKYFHIQRRKDHPEHGFGLGLAFCKSAVEEHGGQIGLASQEGSGTTFWILLPLAPQASMVG